MVLILLLSVVGISYTYIWIGLEVQISEFPTFGMHYLGRVCIFHIQMGIVASKFLAILRTVNPIVLLSAVNLITFLKLRNIRLERKMLHYVIKNIRRNKFENQSPKEKKLLKLSIIISLIHASILAPCLIFWATYSLNAVALHQFWGSILVI